MMRNPPSMVMASLVLAVATFVSSPAFAFCGYFVGSTKALYNDATQVVLMRHGTTTVVSMRPDYRGPIADFAMVIPVPQVLTEEDVVTLSRRPLDIVDALTSPRLVEYHEADPCARRARNKSGIDSILARVDEPGSAPSVKVVSAFQRGEYSIVILDANDSAALATWLTKNGYKQPPGAAAALAPYIQGGFYFFAAKVDAAKVQFSKGGKAALSPLQFRYSSKSFQLPIRLGLLNAKGKQDLIIFVLAKDRYEVANRPNVFIPTNIDVSEERKGDFGSWYSGQVDARLKDAPSAVITEYAWPVRMKCDPCPHGLSVLGAADLAALGGELLGPQAPVHDMVLTRLHTRYDAKGGSSDLVFQKAKPVSGGREAYVDGKLELGATDASVNAFQARYAIRHQWKGPTTCENPQPGQWTSQVSALPGWGPVAPPLVPTPSSSGPPPALTRADVKRTIARYQSRIDNCAATQNKGGLTGVVRVKFEIGPNGRTRNERVVSPQMADTDVGECVRKVVGSMTFPKTSATSDLPLTYPFRLK